MSRDSNCIVQLERLAYVAFVEVEHIYASSTYSLLVLLNLVGGWPYVHLSRVDAKFSSIHHQTLPTDELHN